MVLQLAVLSRLLYYGVTTRAARLFTVGSCSTRDYSSGEQLQIPLSVLRRVYTVALATLLLAPTIHLFFASIYGHFTGALVLHDTTFYIAGTYRPHVYCTFARTVHPIESSHTHTA